MFAVTAGWIQEQYEAEVCYILGNWKMYVSTVQILACVLLLRLFPWFVVQLGRLDR